MDETFELPVHHKGTDLLLPAQLQTWGYSHRILVTLSGQVVVFEPDEERNYRAVLTDTEKPPDVELVRAAAAAIELLFR